MAGERYLLASGIIREHDRFLGALWRKESYSAARTLAPNMSLTSTPVNRLGISGPRNKKFRKHCDLQESQVEDPKQKGSMSKSLEGDEG